jgi:hypothetical protein
MLPHCARTVLAMRREFLGRHGHRQIAPTVRSSRECGIVSRGALAFFKSIARSSIEAQKIQRLILLHCKECGQGQ